MTRMTTDTGFLNPEGKAACEHLKAEIAKILATQTDEIYLRTLGCNLKAMVGDEVSAAMRRITKP